MDYKTAKKLLDRYFAGESSVAEEAQLVAYFQQTDLPKDMVPYQPLFQFFAQAKQQGTGKDFSPRSLQHQAKTSTAKLVPRRRYLWHMVAVAAMVILAMATWFLVPATPSENPQTAIDWSQYEPQSEEDALRITTTALRKTSTSLRLGLGAATQELKNVKKIIQPF